MNNKNNLEDEFLNSKTYQTIKNTSETVFREVGNIANDVSNTIHNEFNNPFNSSPNMPYNEVYARGDGSRVTKKYEPNAPKEPKKPNNKEKKKKRKFVFRGLQIFLCIAVPITVLGLEPLGGSILELLLAGVSIFAVKYFFDFVNYLYYKGKKDPEIKVDDFKKVEVPQEKPTGNSELDKIISDGQKYIAQLKFADDVILNEEISECIRRMEKSTKDIFSFVKSNPKKIPQIKKFMNYYLPTTLKLLTSYQKLNNQSVKGENINSTMLEIERMMDTIASAFEKQLDTLFSQEAMQIQTDITVFDSILEQDGLKDDEDETINLQL